MSQTSNTAGLCWWIYRNPGALHALVGKVPEHRMITWCNLGHQRPCLCLHRGEVGGDHGWSCHRCHSTHALGGGDGHQLAGRRRRRGRAGLAVNHLRSGCASRGLQGNTVITAPFLCLRYSYGTCWKWNYPLGNFRNEHEKCKRKKKAQICLTHLFGCVLKSACG